MPFDNVCKLIAEMFPRDYAAWALHCSVADLVEVKTLKTELSIEPIRADSVIFLQADNSLVHLEFQLTAQSKPPLPLRMLDYWVRLYRKYEIRVTQMVVVLQDNGSDVPTEFRAENTWHRYQVIKLWETDPNELMAFDALLPLATLARTDQPENLLIEIARRVQAIPDREEMREVSSCTQIVAGLRFTEEIVHRLFREEIMQESVIYQEIIQKGLYQGIQQGIQQADLATALRLLNRRFGLLFDQARKDQVAKLNTQLLEKLAEDLLDFKEMADFDHWIASNTQ